MFHGGGADGGPPPLLIIAGAGSGKTNTLAHRVAHLIVNGADPRRIRVAEPVEAARYGLAAEFGVAVHAENAAAAEGADVIVAINTDPNAPIFDFAHHGIVGNAMQVLPVLTQAFRTHLDKRIRKVA